MMGFQNNKCGASPYCTVFRATNHKQPNRVACEQKTLRGVHTRQILTRRTWLNFVDRREEGRRRGRERERERERGMKVSEKGDDNAVERIPQGTWVGINCFLLMPQEKIKNPDCPVARALFLQRKIDHLRFIACFLFLAQIESRHAQILSHQHPSVRVLVVEKA
jgi:hypothetical protein